MRRLCPTAMNALAFPFDLSIKLPVSVSLDMEKPPVTKTCTCKGMTRCHLHAHQVRKSMARIKLVLTERAIAEPNPEVSQQLRRFINAL